MRIGTRFIHCVNGRFDVKSLVSSERAAFLQTLYAAALNGETVQQATAQLIEIWNNPETIFDHLLLCRHSEDGNTRTSAALSLLKLVKTHFDVLGPDQIIAIRDALFEITLAEQVPLIRYHVIDVIRKILTNVGSVELWQTAGQLGNQLLQLPSHVSAGLYLWDMFLDAYPDDIELQQIAALMSVAIAAIDSPSPDDRLQAISIIGTLLEWEDIEPVGLVPAIIKEVNDLITTRPSEVELVAIVKLVCDIMDEPPDSIDTLELAGMAVAVISNPGIDVNVRYIVHNIIEESAELFAMCAPDKIPPLVEMSSRLSCEICQSERDTDKYEFPLSLFHRIACSFDEDPQATFALFMTCVMALMQGDVVGKQVAMLVLKAVVEGTRECFANQLGDVLRVIFAAGETHDPCVVVACCSTIAEIIDVLSGPISAYVNEVTAFLFANIAAPNAVRTMDALFYKCDQAPGNIGEVIGALVSLIPVAANNQIEEILSCISSSMSNMGTINEEAYGSLVPVLNEIMTHKPDLRGPVVEFFGNIARISPASVASELPKIVEFGITCYGDNDNWLASIAFGLIAQVLPITMRRYVGAIVPCLVAVLQIEDEEDMIEMQHETISRSQNEALSTLSAFLCYMPDVMQEYAEMIFGCIMNCNSRVGASHAVAFAAEGFREMGVSLNEYLVSNLSEICSLEDKDEIHALLMAFTEIACVYGRDIPMEMVLQALNSIFNSPPPSFLSGGRSQSIDPHIQECLFNFLNEVIDAAGPAFAPCVESFFAALQKHMSSSAVTRANIIMTFSHICFVCGIQTELYQIAINSAVREIVEVPNTKAKIILAKALKWLVMTNQAAVAERFDVIGPFAINVLTECDDYVLWCALTMASGSITDPGSLETVLGLMPAQSDSEHVSLCADFAVFLANTAPDTITPRLPEFAVALLSSSHKHLRSEATVAAMASVLEKLADGDLLSVCENNEFKFWRIKKNIAGLRT